MTSHMDQADRLSATPAGRQRLPQRSRYLQALHGFALDLLLAQNVREAFHIVRVQLDHLLQPDGVSLLLVNDDGQYLQECDKNNDGASSWAPGPLLRVQLHTNSEPDSPARLSFLEQRAIHLPRLPRNLHHITASEVASLKPGTTLSIIPLAASDGPLGVLMVRFAPGQRVGKNAASLLETLAQTLGPGIESIKKKEAYNQQLAADLEEARPTTTTGALVEIARTAGSTLELSDVLNQVVRKTAQLMAADLCSLWLLSEDSSLLLPSAMFGRDEEFVSRWKGQAIPLDREPLSMEVVNTSKPVVVVDAESDPRTDKQAVKFFGDKSIVVVPLLTKGKILGTLFLNHTRSYRRYANQDIEVALAIASQAASAIDNARLYGEARRWTLHLEALQSLVAKLNANNTVSGIGATIAAETRKIINYDTCRVFLLNQENQELVPVVYEGVAKEYQPEPPDQLRIKLGQGIAGSVAQTGVPELVNDVTHDSRQRHILGPSQADESMIACPLIYEDRVTGVITLAKRGFHSFSTSDLRLLNILAIQAAIAIENARLFEETVQKSEQLRVSFRRIGEALAASPDLAETTQLILDLVSGVVQADACVLQVVDDEHSIIHEAGTGEGREALAEALGKSGDSLIGLVLRDGMTIHASDTSNDPRTAVLPAEITSRWPVYLGLPLLLAGKPIGVLSVLREAPEPFPATEIEILASFATHAAIAVDRSRLFSALQERLDQFSGLHELSKIISSVTSWEDTLAQLVQQMGQLVGVERCVIMLYEEEIQALVAQAPGLGFTNEEIAALQVPLYADLPAIDVWRTGQTYINNNADLALNEQETTENTEHSLLIVPMRLGDRAIGVIRAANKHSGHFSENDVKLLTILATQAANIMENAALYRKVSLDKEQLDAIFNNTSDAIFIIDENKQILRLNPAASFLTNWSQGEALGRPCGMVYRPHDVEGNSLCDPETCPLDRIRATKEPVPYLETIASTSNGKEIDIAVSYSYFVSNDSFYGIAIARDISKVKEVDRFKSEFISMVSHEFRSPLALIKGYASTMLRPDLSLDPRRERQFLLGINDGVERLNRLVDNLLSTSRIDAGRLRPNPRSFDLAEIISKVATSFQEADARHRVVFDFSSQDLVVRADRDQIEQVLVNLIGNAIKYSPDGESVRITAHKDKLYLNPRGDIGSVIVSVEDQGIGIPEPMLDKVFDKWFRVDDPRGPATPGTGLGLYVCKSIIEAHNGSILATSRPGQGTTVTFALPLSTGVTLAIESGGATSRLS